MTQALNGEVYKIHPPEYPYWSGPNADQRWMSINFPRQIEGWSQQEALDITISIETTAMIHLIAITWSNR